MSSRFRNQLLVSTLLAGVASATPVAAQVTGGATTDTSATAPAIVPQETALAEDNGGGEIVVTGSLIRNPNLTSAVPVTAINAAEIVKRAPNTVEEALRALPGVVPGLGTQVNNGANGTNTLNLRGLGAQRNLVLLDGNRIVPATADGATDLNVIPLALLQRIELLTGGASTTYGADAVAGVANFITRRDFTGVDLRAGYKVTERGDGQSYNAALTLGANFADDRGNAVISMGYNKVRPVYQVRDFALFGVNSVTGVASGASFTSVPTTISFPSGADLQVNPAGNALVPQYQGFNFNPYNIFQTPLDRKSLYASARYDVSDNIEVYGRGLFAQTTIRQIIAPSGVFGQQLTVPGNNAYLPAGIRDQICAQNGIALGAACNTNPALTLPAVYRRLVELGPRISTWESNVYDARAGIRANITSTMKLDVSGSYGRSEISQAQTGYTLNSRIQQALNATSTTACTVTTGGCVPLNLFGQAGSISPAQVAFIQGASSIRINTELKQAHAVLNGDFGFTSPGATQPVGFAVGGEYRNYSYERLPDAFAQNPIELGGAGGAILPFAGGYSVKEAFGEIIAPIFADRPFFHELTVEGGIRYSSYDIRAAGNPKFNATTYKGGATWSPVEGIRVRGNYQRAVRAPNIGELFAPVVTGLTSLTTDPCAGAAPTTNANLRAVCIAQGAPAATIGVIQNPSAGQANATGGGNPNIRPEKANTLTGGVVVTPSQYIPGLSVSVDYYKIKVTNAITAALPQDVIAGCFGNITAASATSAACTGIVRSAANGRLSGSTATVFGLPVPLTNNGRYKTSGIDLTVDYTRNVGVYKINLNFAGNYTHDLRFKAAPSSYTRNCVGYYSANCGPYLGQIQPKFSWQQRTTVGTGPASLSLLWRHIDGVRYEGQAADFALRGFTAANRNLFSGAIRNGAGVSSSLAGQTYNLNRIKAYNYLDLVAQFEVTKTFQLTFGVQNLLDRDPPITGGQAGTTTANSGNTFPSTYDPLGRTFSIQGRVTF